jgi:DNA-binding transcriptional regulator YhcF (GntR family)
MGFTSIENNFFKSDFWLSERFTKAQAFLDLLANAKYQDVTSSENGVRIALKRGQSSISILSFANRWQWDRKTVMRFFDMLEEEGVIKQKRTTLTTIITIINYNDLRGTQEPDLEKKGQQDGHQKGHSIREEELLEPQILKNSYSPREVEYWMAYAIEQGFTEERGREFFEWNEERNWTDKAGKTVCNRKSAARGFFRKKRPDAEPIPTRTQQLPTVRTERKGIESPEIVEFFFNNGKNGQEGFQFYAECLARQDINTDNWQAEALKRINGVAA